MKRPLVVRDRPIRQFPGDAVSFFVSAALTSPPNFSIAVDVDVGGPEPARSEFGPMRWHRTGLVDLRPKSLGERRHSRSHQRVRSRLEHVAKWTVSRAWISMVRLVSGS